MKLIVLILLAACIASTTAENHQMDITSDPPNQNVASRISTIIVNTISRAFAFLFEFIDIKTRAIRMLSSLYTTDNLVLFKKLLNMGLRFGNWLYGVVPDSTGDGTNHFLSFLFPQVDYDEVVEDVSEPSDLGMASGDVHSQNRPTITVNIPSRSDSDDLAVSETYDNYNEVMNLRRLVEGTY